MNQITAIGELFYTSPKIHQCIKMQQKHTKLHQKYIIIHQNPTNCFKMHQIASQMTKMHQKYTKVQHKRTKLD